LLKTAPEIPGMAQKHDVTLVAGPFVNRQHLTFVVVEADRAEQVDSFIHEARLDQWNQVRVIPSMPMEDIMGEAADSPALF
jgi:hypothetical protein